MSKTSGIFDSMALKLAEESLDLELTDLEVAKFEELCRQAENGELTDHEILMSLDQLTTVSTQNRVA